MKKKKELANAAARGVISGCRVPGRRRRAVVVLPFFGSPLFRSLFICGRFLYAMVVVIKGNGFV